MKKGVVVDEKFCLEEETQLTVHKTSMFFPGYGFLAYDAAGELLFRFESYGSNPPSDELALMDASGKCLLTLFRKKPSLHQRWEGVVGEELSGGEQSKAAFSIRRSSIIGRSNVLVDIYGDEGEEYEIVGSFPRRCCAVYGGGDEPERKEALVEIKRKVDLSTNVMLGKDVFLLSVRAGFDCAFAMGLVLVLDQIYDDDDDDDDDEDVESEVRRACGDPSIL